MVASLYAAKHTGTQQYTVSAKLKAVVATPAPHPSTGEEAPRRRSPRRALLIWLPTYRDLKKYGAKANNRYAYASWAIYRYPA